jgi:hypothetical protein
MIWWPRLTAEERILLQALADACGDPQSGQPIEFYTPAVLLAEHISLDTAAEVECTDLSLHKAADRLVHKGLISRIRLKRAIQYRILDEGLRVLETLRRGKHA